MPLTAIAYETERPSIDPLNQSAYQHQKPVAALTNLTTLSLAGTNWTDEGLSELAALKNLTSLSLNGPQVTDAGLKSLAPLKNLTGLNQYAGAASARDCSPRSWKRRA